MKILETPLQVTIRGELCKVHYRAVMHEASVFGPWEIHIEQQVGGKWHSTPGAWLVSSSILVALAGGLWIDFGLGWRLEPNPDLAVEVALIAGQREQEGV